MKWHVESRRRDGKRGEQSHEKTRNGLVRWRGRWEESRTGANCEQKQVEEQLLGLHGTPRIQKFPPSKCEGAEERHWFGRLETLRREARLWGCMG